MEVWNEYALCDWKDDGGVGVNRKLPKAIWLITVVSSHVDDGREGHVISYLTLAVPLRGDSEVCSQAATSASTRMPHLR
jgi:hypothetical protein